MNTLPSLASLVVATLCFLVDLPITEQAIGKPLDKALPLGDESALICEAGSLLGGGRQAKAAANTLVPANDPTRRQILIQIITQLDVNRDQLLDHRELKAIHHLARQQLLDELDSNLDRQLSTEELQQSIQAQNSTPNDYPNPPVPWAPEPPEPETFRNLRRYGVGIQQLRPAPRSEPFARAARFGTSPGFRPPVKKGSNNRPSGGSCRASGNTQATWSLRVGSVR